MKLCCWSRTSFASAEASIRPILGGYVMVLLMYCNKIKFMAWNDRHVMRGG